MGALPESRWLQGPRLGLRVGVGLRRSLASRGLLGMLWKRIEVLGRVRPKLSGSSVWRQI